MRTYVTDGKQDRMFCDLLNPRLIDLGVTVQRDDSDTVFDGTGAVPFARIMSQSNREEHAMLSTLHEIVLYVNRGHVYRIGSLTEKQMIEWLDLICG